MALCMSLLAHPLAYSEYQSALISRLTVVAIDEHGSWLSAIVKLARLIVVHSAYLKVNSSIQLHLRL